MGDSFPVRAAAAGGQSPNGSATPAQERLTAIVKEYLERLEAGDPPDKQALLRSLGATLYELATLEPAFGGDDRQQLLRRIIEEAPLPPRQVRAAVPRDLETIVLKAMSPDATSRYGTARELADDLRRFVLDRPVLARRPSLVDRTVKWSRRHLAVVLAAVVVLMMSVVALGIGAVLIEKERTEAIRQRDASRRNLYLVDMRAAQQDWKAGQIDRMTAALNRLVPEGSAPDLRGWEWYYLKNLCDKPLFTLHHPDRVRSVDWCPDGRWLASAGYGGQLKIWDPATGKQRMILVGHTGQIFSIRWFKDNRLASAAADGMVKIWEGATGKELHTLRGHRNFVRSLAWRPDGEVLASASHDKTVRYSRSIHSKGSSMQSLGVRMGGRLPQLEMHNWRECGTSRPALKI